MLCVCRGRVTSISRHLHTSPCSCVCRGRVTSVSRHLHTSPCTCVVGVQLFTGIYVEDPLFMCELAQHLVNQQEQQSGARRSHKERQLGMVEAVSRVMEVSDGSLFWLGIPRGSEVMLRWHGQKETKTGGKSLWEDLGQNSFHPPLHSTFAHSAVLHFCIHYRLHGETSPREYVV